MKRKIRGNLPKKHGINESSIYKTIYKFTLSMLLITCCDWNWIILNLKNFPSNPRLPKHWNWLIYHRTMTYTILPFTRQHLDWWNLTISIHLRWYLPIFSIHSRTVWAKTAPIQKHNFFWSRRRSDRFPVNVGLKHGTIWWKPPCGAPCGCFFRYIDKLSVTRCSSIALAENGCSKGGRKMAEIDWENLIEITWNNMFHDCSRLSK